MANKKYINLLERHDPPMDAGEYEITVRQTLSIKDSLKMGKPEDALKKTFFVAGERFTLGPDSIHSVYPPPGSQGEHTKTFPHLILNRSTLPWERSMEGGTDGIWLGLLLFDEAETPKLKTVPLREIYNGTIGADKEFGDGDELDAVSIIEVSPEILRKIMPRRTDLRYTAHSRREGTGEEENGQLGKSTFQTTGPERAVIIGNRLPKANELSTVHLVSLERRFVPDGEFDYSNLKDGKIQLVSLKSWSFTSLNPQYSLFGMLGNLDRTPDTLAMPHAGLPLAAQEILRRGYLALPHHFRKGKNAVSWYRGPLSLPTESPGFKLPATSSDQLLVFDQATGMFDVSFAAAWQLGRLMALEDRQFSLELFKLKKHLSLAAKRTRQSVPDYLQLGDPDYAQGAAVLKARVQKETVEKVEGWMERRHTLEQVPFQYLVPDEEMLPPESLRFFRIDPQWVRCLKDGAASIGRTTSADFKLDKAADFAAGEVPVMSGFLLRSELVGGYPGLQVLGYAQTKNDDDLPDESTAMPILRKEILSDTVLLCIFAGEVKTVDFFQKPDTIHLGLDLDEGGFFKQMRHANGKNMPDVEASNFRLGPAHWHEEDPNRKADFAKIAEDLKVKLGSTAAATEADISEFAGFTSADFSLQMMEGVERVRFVHRDS